MYTYDRCSLPESSREAFVMQMSILSRINFVFSSGSCESQSHLKPHMSKFEMIQNDAGRQQLKMRNESRIAMVIRLRWYEADGQKHEIEIGLVTLLTHDSHKLAEGLRTPPHAPQSAPIVFS